MNSLRKSTAEFQAPTAHKNNNYGPTLPSNIIAKAMLLPLVSLTDNHLPNILSQLSLNPLIPRQLILIAPDQNFASYGLFIPAKSQLNEASEYFVATPQNPGNKSLRNEKWVSNILPATDRSSTLLSVTEQLNTQFEKINILPLTLGRLGTHRFCSLVDTLTADDTTLIIGFIDIKSGNIGLPTSSVTINKIIDSIEQRTFYDLPTQEIDGYWLIQGLLSWARNADLNITLVDGPTLWPTDHSLGPAPFLPVILFHW